jgi:hypothetical protein
MPSARQAVLEALSAEIARRTRWDEQPALYTLHLTRSHATLRQLPIHPAAWATGAPAEVLAEIAADLAGAPHAPAFLARPDLHGAAFFAEAWAVDGPEQTQRAVALGSAARSPDRVETRQLWAVDRARTTYEAWQARGRDQVNTAVRTAPGPVAAGTIPEALDSLVRTALGVTLPKRLPPPAFRPRRRPPGPEPGGAGPQASP